jgi:hypothetical protein
MFYFVIFFGGDVSCVYLSVCLVCLTISNSVIQIVCVSYLTRFFILDWFPVPSFYSLPESSSVDYSRMGVEYAALDMIQPGDSAIMPLASNTTATSTITTSNTTGSRSCHLQCLFLELELGLVAVSMCVGVDCMVIAIASPTAPLGMVKARLQAITEYVQEALIPLTTEASYG